MRTWMLPCPRSAPQLWSRLHTAVLLHHLLVQTTHTIAYLFVTHLTKINIIIYLPKPSKYIVINLYWIILYILLYLEKSKTSAEAGRALAGHLGQGDALLQPPWLGRRGGRCRAARHPVRPPRRHQCPDRCRGELRNPHPKMLTCREQINAALPITLFDLNRDIEVQIHAEAKLQSFAVQALACQEVQNCNLREP